jgi:hypothetical protein
MAGRIAAAWRTGERCFFLQQLLAGTLLVHRTFLVALDGGTFLPVVAGAARRLRSAAGAYRNRRVIGRGGAVAPVESGTFASAFSSIAEDRHTCRRLLVCRSAGAPASRPAPPSGVTRSHRGLVSSMQHSGGGGRLGLDAGWLRPLYGDSCRVRALARDPGLGDSLSGFPAFPNSRMGPDMLDGPHFLRALSLATALLHARTGCYASGRRQSISPAPGGDLCGCDSQLLHLGTASFRLWPRGCKPISKRSREALSEAIRSSIMEQ